MFARVPRLAAILIIFCAALLASACGEPPTREMDQAQGAIDAARAAGADRYATEEYQAAVDALKQAQDAVAQRDYRLALNHALDSRERAQNSAKQAAEQQVTLRSGAERRLGEVTALLAQANQRLAAAEAARIPRRSLTAQRAAIASADTSLQKAGTQINDGDYKASQQQLSETAAQLRAVISQLDGMVGGRAGRPKR
jgi:flagella basal body P-ring formation protein FlgA